MKTINQKIRDIIFNPISIKKQRDNKRQVDLILKSPVQEQMSKKK